MNTKKTCGTVIKTAVLLLLNSGMICILFILFCKIRAAFNHLANEAARLARLLLGPKTYTQAYFSLVTSTAKPNGPNEPPKI